MAYIVCFFRGVFSILTELLPADASFLQIADDCGGGISDVCVFGCDFVVFSKIKIVPIAEPRAGIRSFSDCNCVAKFCSNARISSLASCSDKRCSESFQIKTYFHVNAITVVHLWYIDCIIWVAYTFVCFTRLSIKW